MFACYNSFSFVSEDGSYKTLLLLVLLTVWTCGRSSSVLKPFIMVMLAVWSLISQMVFHECKRAHEQPFCFYFVWTFYSTRNAFLTFSACFGKCSLSSIIDNQCDNKPQWHHHQRRSGTGNKWVVERQKNTNLKELTFRQTQTGCDPRAKILQSWFMGNFTASRPV